jgi:hypothetical protein
MRNVLRRGGREMRRGESVGALAGQNLIGGASLPVVASK